MGAWYIHVVMNLLPSTNERPMGFQAALTDLLQRNCGACNGLAYMTCSSSTHSRDLYAAMIEGCIRQKDTGKEAHCLSDVLVEQALRLIPYYPI
jgi:hypothetical protein